MQPDNISLGSRLISLVITDSLVTDNRKVDDEVAYLQIRSNSSSVIISMKI